jgi:hypothetical protein
VGRTGVSVFLNSFGGIQVFLKWIKKRKGLPPKPSITVRGTEKMFSNSYSG